MENYSELIKLRKLYGTFNQEEEAMENATKQYPATTIAFLFGEQLSEKDKVWLSFENEVIFNRKQQILPHAVVLGLKDYIYLINKDTVIDELITTLYDIDAFDPNFSFVPIDDLPTNLKNTVKKVFATLILIEKSMSVFAIGMFNNKPFTYCQYDKISKNIAHVFIENSVSVLFARFKNQICLFFDPMLFSEEDLNKVANKINQKLKVHTIVNTNYDNYSVSFVKDIDCVDIFNIINEEPQFNIGSSNQQNNLKPKINKPLIRQDSIDKVNIPKSNFSSKFKK